MARRREPSGSTLRGFRSFGCMRASLGPPGLGELDASAAQVSREGPRGRRGEGEGEAGGSGGIGARGSRGTTHLARESSVELEISPIGASEAWRRVVATGRASGEALERETAGLAGRAAMALIPAPATAMAASNADSWTATE